MRIASRCPPCRLRSYTPVSEVPPKTRNAKTWRTSLHCSPSSRSMRTSQGSAGCTTKPTDDPTGRPSGRCDRGDRRSVRICCMISASNIIRNPATGLARRSTNCSSPSMALNWSYCRAGRRPRGPASIETAAMVLPGMSITNERRSWRNVRHRTRRRFGESPDGTKRKGLRSPQCEPPAIRPPQAC